MNNKILLAGYGTEHCINIPPRDWIGLFLGFNSESLVIRLFDSQIKAVEHN